jgi:hypothetical protein
MKKYEGESGKKFESVRRAAALSGRLRRADLCACGRPTALVRRGHHWQRLTYCGHCGRAAADEAALGPYAANANQVARRAA